jgi:hypothetical protein
MDAGTLYGMAVSYGKERIMTTAKIVGGAILVLIGLLWILQGLNVVTGSGMSGHGIYAILGLVVAVIGAGLLWSSLRLHPRGQGQ